MLPREENRRDFDLSEAPELTDKDVDGALCFWCDAPLPAGETDYCDALCAAMADRDNMEDR